jgi:hypothetical protein
VPHETGFMRAQLSHRFIPFKFSGKGWYRRLGWSHKEFDRLQAEFYDTIFQRYVEKQGKQRWGEKTPLHTWHIDDMARLFPDSVFIAIVRHPGGSVASNMSRFNESLGRAKYHYLRYNHEIVRQAANYGERFAIMRYEDLVLKPEEFMRRLLDWLGEPWDPAVLAHHEVQGQRKGKMKVEGRSMRDDPIDVSRITKWTQTLGEREQAAIRQDLGPIGEVFGYSAEKPAEFAPLHPDGDLLIDGIHANELVDRFPELDLRTQPPIPLTERPYNPRQVALAFVDVPEGDPAAEEGALNLTKGELPGLQGRLRPLVRRLPPRARRTLSEAARRLEGRRLGEPRRIRVRR